MVKKTIKKTKPATKKVVAKKATAKTVAAKPVAAKQLVDAPMHECHCGCNCCCRGHRFIGFCIKVIILCIVFLLGCVSAPWLMRKGHDSMMRHIAFDDNGCVVLESIKCPKLLETLATSDDDANGCISREELESAMKEMRKPNAE